MEGLHYIREIFMTSVIVPFCSIFWDIFILILNMQRSIFSKIIVNMSHKLDI